MTNFDEFLEEQLQNPKFKAELDALEPEFSIVQAIIDARKQTVNIVSPSNGPESLC